MLIAANSHLKPREIEERGERRENRKNLERKTDKEKEIGAKKLLSMMKN